MTTHYGPDLEAGVGHLKGLPELAEDAQDGMTQADLDAAMDAADARIESLFGGDYDISGWREEPPPLIAILWDLFAAARVIEFRDLRLGLPGDDGRSAAARLHQTAQNLLDRILHGWPERLWLCDAEGRLVRPKKNRSTTQPRAKSATSDRF